MIDPSAGTSAAEPTPGLTNPDDVAEAVIARLPAATPVAWWRPLARGTRSLGLVAAAIVAVVVAIAVLPPGSAPGPGTSTVPTSTAPDGPTDDPAPTATPTMTDPGAGPTLSDLRFSTNAVSLEGFDTADINVTATFEGDVIPYGQMDGSTTPLVCLEKVGARDPQDPHSTLLARTMLQTEGTNEWVASFRLTAGDSGRWRATCLVAISRDGVELSLNPELEGMSAVLDISGTHAPYHTMEFNPSPAVIGQPLEVFGQVTDQDTGEPLADVTVTIGIDNVCAEGGGGTTVTTNPNGAYSYTIPVADGSAVCTWITDLPGIFPGVNAQDPIAVYGMLFSHPTDL